MNAFGYIRITLEKNGKQYHLDLPVGVPWEDCTEAAVDFIPLIKQLKENARSQNQAPQASVDNP